LTAPACGGVLSMIIAPVLVWLTKPTEFSAQILIMFGFPVNELFCVTDSSYFQNKKESCKQIVELDK
jgi:hypothetical protein